MGKQRISGLMLRRPICLFGPKEQHPKVCKESPETPSSYSVKEECVFLYFAIVLTSSAIKKPPQNIILHVALPAE